MTGMTLLWVGVGMGLGWFGHHLWHQRSRSSPPTSPRTPQPTELTRLQEQLHQTELAYYTAVELSQFKGSFLARTSHELRSPMNGIIGMHQLILEDLTDSPAEERAFIAQANTSALKMVKVLDEVIAAAKVTQGTVDLNVQPVALLGVLQTVKQLTHLQAQNRNLKFTVTLPAEDRYILADPARLRQVWVSLVDAAIAQMPEGDLSLQVIPGPTPDLEVIQLEMRMPAQQWLVDLTQPPTCLEHDRVTTLDKAAIVQLANRPFPEPGFAFAVARSLMVSMSGTLDVMTLADQPDRSQIRGTIPRVLPDASVD